MRASQTKVLCKAFFTCLGVPVWGVNEFEYDDLCAYLVDQFRHRFNKIVAMTNDSDVYQLFRVPGFSVFRGKTGFYTRTDFDGEFNKLDPLDWKHVLSMAGSHNCVKGVKGVGFTTAAKILRDPVKLRQFRSEHQELMERNLRLVELPHPTFAKLMSGGFETVPTFLRLAYDERKLIRFCNVYDIKFTTDMRESFSRICEA
jgi:5'-3' exonuclease